MRRIARIGLIARIELLQRLIGRMPVIANVKINGGVVFNGTTDALVRNPLRANAGETVRIFFGVGGPNRTSSFHVIGEIFDRAWPLAGLTSAPMTDVQTITVPPGGAAVTDFRTEVPGRFILVDHALSRLERGLAGHLVVEGEARADLFRPHQPLSDMAGH